MWCIFCSLTVTMLELRTVTFLCPRIGLSGTTGSGSPRLWIGLLLRIACTRSAIRYKVCLSFSVCGPSLAESEVSMFFSVLSSWTGTFFLPIQWRPTSFDLLCLENFCFSSCY